MLTWSKVAVAWVGEPLIDRWNDTGEVTNSPTATGEGSPARWVLPIWVQVVPLAES